MVLEVLREVLPGVEGGLQLSLGTVQDRRDEGFKALRKALGYGWSVAVAAHPAMGKPRIERWFGSPDPDVRWIMRENLKKNRLQRMAAKWVKAWGSTVVQ